MKIAVCDDEKEIRSEISRYILRLYPETEIALFESGEKLLGSGADFDVIYLDIKMSGTDGMETARTLRKNGCGAVLIFVTALEEYVWQSFDVGAFHYLLKPIDPVKFYEILRKTCGQARETRASAGESLLVKNGRDRVKIFFSDIIYAEVFNRKIAIYTHGGEVEYYGRMEELEKRAGKGFFRTHRAFLVNLAEVVRYNCAEIILEKGSVPIAKRKYPLFVREYLEFLKSENGDE